MTPATLRAAAAIITAAAERTGREWWQHIATDLNHLADQTTQDNRHGDQQEGEHS